jgi:hypothetical protein
MIALEVAHKSVSAVTDAGIEILQEHDTHLINGKIA